ncbi:MAG: NAD(P)-dependent oxidoreductase [Actinomycetota bacterium]|nr:NAD(P)-dependent oxidoreductase [Actinomycetota bacterium]
MKVFLTGATGVMGRHAATALRAAGHAVGGLARTPEKARELSAAGVRPVVGSLFDVDALAEAFAGHDAVCNLATHIPVGLSGVLPGAWRSNDRIRTEGSRVVAMAAKRAGVLRLVQESVSFLYADGSDQWLDESSPLIVTRATEPAAVAETNAAEFACAHRTAVVLRFGTIVGDDPLTRWRLARGRAGQAFGVGDPEGWVHLVHPTDVGTAVVAALHAPSGAYNVGAEPVRRAEFTEALAAAAGQSRVAYLPKLLVRLAGERLEPLTRSHRISSARFAEHTGWVPVHPRFSAGWLHNALVAA